jgi:uncharacterized protein
MKYLLVLVLVLAVIWFVRNNRRTGQDKPAPPKQDSPAQPQDMVRCPICGLHLPRADALPGPGGQLYCCAEHRLLAGD